MNRQLEGLQPDAIARATDTLGWTPSKIEVADTFAARLGGLIIRPPIEGAGELRVLVFPKCHAVHTCFMRYPLDIAFVDARGDVLVLYQGVAPWRFLSHPSAAAVLERASVMANFPLCFA